jgi:hypothetical protein
VDFERPYVASIEEALENQPNLRGRWRRLESVAENPSAVELRPVAAWKIDLPVGTVACPGVMELWILVAATFPYSQPRIIVSSLREDGTWPHVENSGALCLSRSSVGADPGRRVVQHLADTIDLLNYSDDRRKREFREEFATYWRRRGDQKSAHKHWSLVTPEGPSREVRRYFNAKAETHVWADSKGQLADWLRNAGVNPATRELEAAWAVWLPQAPTPEEFPKFGADVLAHVPLEVQQQLIRPGERFPVLVGAPTTAGSVWVAVELSTANERELQKGFRAGRVPVQRVVNSMASRPVRLLPVERIDGAYVHGRGRDEQYAELSKHRIALIGCGSLGSMIARLLAQAGVGRFIFVDGDAMAAHNTSRHVLGNPSVGKQKAVALALALEQDFPHHGRHDRYVGQFESLTPEQLTEIAECELIISAGIDFAGDMALNEWRRSLVTAPPHVCTWVEPFAIAGHAIALFESDDLSIIFDAHGNSTIELTHWPDTVQIRLREAGCGNMFQPHGAIDLQRTALTATNLCLDILQGAVTESCRRAWLGDLKRLSDLGGIASAAFDRSNTETSASWKPPATVADGFGR